MSSIFDEMRENADKIQKYPELEIVAKQMREDALIFENTVKGAKTLIGCLIIALVMFAIGLFSLKSSYDKMYDNYTEHLKNDIEMLKKQ